MQTPELVIALLSSIIIITHLSTGTGLYDIRRLEWDWNWNAGPDGFAQRGDNSEAGLPFRLEVFRSNPSEPSTFFVTVPRFKNSSLNPAGLNMLTPPGGLTKGLLRPFPNWEINKLGNCSNLQSPTGMVLGRNGHLYVIDMGRVDVVTPSPRNLCPAKLVVFSLTGQLVESYEFPDSVVSRTNNFLTDIVLDYVDPVEVLGPKFAYMSDVSSIGKIVVFDFTTKLSWSVTDGGNYLPHRNFFIQGKLYETIGNFSSIVLTPDFHFLYYSVTGYKTLWQIPTWALRNSSIGVFQTKNIDSLDQKCNYGSLETGYIGLYYGDLEFGVRWDIHPDRKAKEAQNDKLHLHTNSFVLKNWETLHWTSALRLYKNVYYPETDSYYLSNQTKLFITGKLNFNSTQVVINSTQVNANVSQINFNSSQVDVKLSRVNYNLTQLNYNVSQVNFNSTHVNFSSTQINFNLTKIYFKSSLVKFNSTQVNCNLTRVDVISTPVYFNSSQANFNASHVNFNSTRIGFNSSKINFNSTLVNFQLARVNFNSTQANFNSTQVKFNASQVNFASTQVDCSSTMVNFNSTQVNLNATLVNFISTQVNFNSTQVNLISTQLNFNSSQVNFNSTQVNFNATHVNFNSTQLNVDSTQFNFNSTQVDVDSVQVNLKASKVNFNSTLVNFNSAQINFNSSQVNFNSTLLNFNSTQVNFNSTEVELNLTQLNFNSTQINLNSTLVVFNSTRIFFNSTQINFNSTQFNFNSTQVYFNSTQITFI